jgi:hypothetical protein
MNDVQEVINCTLINVLNYYYAFLMYLVCVFLFFFIRAYFLIGLCALRFASK